MGQRVLLGGRLDGAQPARSGVHGRAPELVDPDPHPGELLDHGRTDTKAKASLVMTTRSASPRSSAGPDRAGPVTTITTGTMPEHMVRALAARPTVQRGHSVGHVGPAGGQHHDQRDPEGQGRGGRHPHGLAVLDGQRPPADGGHRPHHHGRPAAEVFDPGLDRPGDQSAEDRCGGRIEGHRPMLGNR